MSLHPSLHSADAGASLRTVLKREERIKKLIAEGAWNESSKPFNLPKVKIVRMKVGKKQKKQEQKDNKPAKK